MHIHYFTTRLFLCTNADSDRTFVTVQLMSEMWHEHTISKWAHHITDQSNEFLTNIHPIPIQHTNEFHVNFIKFIGFERPSQGDKMNVWFRFDFFHSTFITCNQCKSNLWLLILIQFEMFCGISPIQMENSISTRHFKSNIPRNET